MTRTNVARPAMYAGLSGWGIVDTLTVAIIAVAFTCVVLRTGHLYTAIIFHLIHDAFLFLVQKPGM